jgi:phosphonate transport system substrate-binding protein
MKTRFLFLLVIIVTLGGCTKKNAEPGTIDNPVKFFIVPSVDTKIIDETSKVLQNFLEKTTPYKFKFSVPNSFIAVVESFGTERADVASLNTFGYILAHERYGTEAHLTVVRFGQDSYRAQIVARSDSTIKEVSDLKGRKFAFVDPASTSGYLLPMKFLHDAGIKLGQTVFANKHDNVITMVYQRQVDAGATFYSPPHDGKIEDARRLVKTQLPDVEDKIKIVSLTDPIPNDPIVFRKNLPQEMKTKIVAAMLEFIKTADGKKVFHEMFGVTDFKTTTDANYDGVRAMLKALGKNASELSK